MTPLSYFAKCIKHKRKVPRAFHNALRRAQPGRKHAKQRGKILMLWRRWLASKP